MHIRRETREYRITIEKSIHKEKGQQFIPCYVHLRNFKSVDANLLLTGTFL